MEFLNSIDPFLLGLFIVPLIVIGSGVLLSYISKKIYVGPLTTLILNMLFEICFLNYISFANIIFPIMSLFFSWLTVSVHKFNKSH